MRQNNKKNQDAAAKLAAAKLEVAKKKKNKRIYFGMDVQDAIVRYNTAEKSGIKNRIYEAEIHRAFDKLAENIINTFKFTYFDYGFEDIKHEVVAFMVMNMHKYDHNKGSKAFSYFSVVAKNYLILHNNANYKKLKAHKDIATLQLVLPEKNKDLEDFVLELVQYFETNIPTMFKKKKDLNVAYAILELIKKKDEIENFNKKALYVLIREMTNVETTHITKVTNIFKKHYRNILKTYESQGTLTTKKSSFF